MEVRPSSVLGKRGGGDAGQLAGRGGISELRAGLPSPAVAGNSDSKVFSPSLSGQVPTSPSLSIQMPPSPSLSARVPPADHPLTKTVRSCGAPKGNRVTYYHLTYDELHQLLRKGGYAGRDSRAAWGVRLLSFEATDRNCSRDVENVMNTSDVSPGVREDGRLSRR